MLRYAGCLCALINAIKHLLSGHNNPAKSAALPSSENCARRVGSRNNYLLILGTIVVGMSKLGNTVPFRTRVHNLNIDTHTPILGTWMISQCPSGACTF